MGVNEILRVETLIQHPNHAHLPNFFGMPLANGPLRLAIAPSSAATCPAAAMEVADPGPMASEGDVTLGP